MQNVARLVRLWLQLTDMKKRREGAEDDSGSYSGKAERASRRSRARWDYRCPSGLGSLLTRRNATKVPAANDRLEQIGGATEPRVLGEEPDESEKKLWASVRVRAG